jgi:hypothetical protein
MSFLGYPAAPLWTPPPPPGSHDCFELPDRPTLSQVKDANARLFRTVSSALGDENARELFKNIARRRPGRPPTPSCSTGAVCGVRSFILPPIPSLLGGEEALRLWTDDIKSIAADVFWIESQDLGDEVARQLFRDLGKRRHGQRGKAKKREVVLSNYDWQLLRIYDAAVDHLQNRRSPLSDFVGRRVFKSKPRRERAIPRLMGECLRYFDKSSDTIARHIRTLLAARNEDLAQQQQQQRAASYDAGPSLLGEAKATPMSVHWEQEPRKRADRHRLAAEQERIQYLGKLFKPTD